MRTAVVVTMLLAKLWPEFLTKPTTWWRGSAQTRQMALRRTTPEVRALDVGSTSLRPTAHVTQPTSLNKHYTVYVTENYVIQHTSHNIRHTTHATKLMSHNIYHTTHITQPMSYNVCHTTYVTQHNYAMHVTQPRSNNIDYTTYITQATSHNLHHAIYITQPTSQKLH